MFKPRFCGCKGIRTCLICEAEFGINKSPDENLTHGNLDLDKCYEFCYLCEDKAWMGQNVSAQHPNHEGSNNLNFPGVLLIPDFLSKVEEKQLVEACDGMPWDLSQSGRRKQNFGPKTNFKKMKINGKLFNGFPSFSKLFQDKLRKVNLLDDFQTIEQCSIEYRPETGACIDPHIDDCWVWGERVISLSLISDSVLTMTKYLGGKDRYNLQHHYNNLSKEEKLLPNQIDQGTERNLLNFSNSKDANPIIRIPMPSRSLLVLYGPSRYEWEHSIIRSDINDRRICMAYREFTKEYLPGGEFYENIGKDVCEKANNFWDMNKINDL